MEDLHFIENATVGYQDLETEPASPPLQFDRPRTGRAERVDAPVLNPVTQDVREVSNIIYERHADGRPPERAYWVGRKLKKCIFGVVKECTLLRFRNDVSVPWEVTAEKAAVKIMSWQKIRQLEHIEDPVKEIAAMQYVHQTAGPHQHVMGLLDVLQDEEYLLMFMPFCSSGDLFGFVQQAGKFPEAMARYWFKQILEVSSVRDLLTWYCFKMRVVVLTILTLFLLLSFIWLREYLTCKELVFAIVTCRWRISWWTSMTLLSLSTWECAYGSPLRILGQVKRRT